MYRVTVFDANATQENPIKPIEKIVSADRLVEFFQEHLNDHTYIVTALIETY